MFRRRLELVIMRVQVGNKYRKQYKLVLSIRAIPVDETYRSVLNSGVGEYFLSSRFSPVVSLF